MDAESNDNSNSLDQTAPPTRCQRPRRRLTSQIGQDTAHNAENHTAKSVPINLEAQKKILNNLAKILRKTCDKRNDAENTYLKAYEHFVTEAEQRIKRNETLKLRNCEISESPDNVYSKSIQLAELIRSSKSIVVYTGAGISTSACIPDYRGPNGLWTQLKKTGTFSITHVSNLAAAKPTFTHMALKELCDRGVVNHIVSQNCDGLHLRSGVPPNKLSLIHGCMFIETCLHCKRVYYRSADVTEKTSRFHHKTGRKCQKCRGVNNELVDTIVLYGEKSRHEQPMNWASATRAAEMADLIICMGSSLKTLRLYSNLWPKSINGRQTKLAIVNLQFTSKDKSSTLKISGKCDDVMHHVMKNLNIEVPEYSWQTDSLRLLQTPFTDEEKCSIDRLSIFEDLMPDSVTIDGTENIITPPQISDESNLTNIKPEPVELSEMPSSPGASSVDTKPCSAIPGWLGRGISRSGGQSKRRKHGNKGKKRAKVPLDQAIDSFALKLEKLVGTGHLSFQLLRGCLDPTQTIATSKFES